MRKGIIFTAIAALAFLAGCKSQQNAPGIPVPPKWQGAPYHISFGALPAKPNPAGVTLPPVKWTANPEMLQTRGDLVILVDLSAVKKVSPVADLLIVGATDIPGAQGALTADYMDVASKQLANMLAAYCIKGKVKVSVALVPSSLPLGASDDLVNDQRLSDWLPTEIVFKNPHPKC